MINKYQLTATWKGIQVSTKAAGKVWKKCNYISQRDKAKNISSTLCQIMMIYWRRKLYSQLFFFLCSATVLYHSSGRSYFIMKNVFFSLYGFPNKLKPNEANGKTFSKVQGRFVEAVKVFGTIVKTTFFSNIQTVLLNRSLNGVLSLSKSVTNK